MTQQELERLCSDNGVPYRIIDGRLQVMDMTVLPAAGRPSLDAQGFFVETLAIEDESSEDGEVVVGGFEDEETTTSDLEAMTIAELRELAEERNVELAPGLRKAEIIQAIEEAQEGA